MKQIQIPSVPQPVVAWIHSHAGKNYWKVRGQCDWDDLIAEGYLAISYCLDRYGTDLAAPHFMRLVQLTFNCAIIDLAKKRTRNSERFVVGTSKRIQKDETSNLDRVVADAPVFIKKALQILMTDMSGQLRHTHRYKNGERETTNARMARLMHFEPSIIEKMNLMDSVRSYLSDHYSV